MQAAILLKKIYHTEQYKRKIHRQMTRQLKTKSECHFKTEKLLTKNW